MVFGAGMESTWPSASRHLPFSAILNLGPPPSPSSLLSAVHHYWRPFRTIQALCLQKPCPMFGITPYSSRNAPMIRKSQCDGVPPPLRGFVIPPYPLHSLNCDAPSLNQRRGVNLRIDTSEAMLQAAKDALYPTYVSVDYDWLAMQATPVDEDGNRCRATRRQALVLRRTTERGKHAEQPHTAARSFSRLRTRRTPSRESRARIQTHAAWQHRRFVSRADTQTTNQTPRGQSPYDSSQRPAEHPSGTISYPAGRPFPPQRPAAWHDPPKDDTPPSPLRTNDLFSSDDEDVDEDAQHVSPPPPYQMHICDFRVARDAVRRFQAGDTCAQ